MFLLSPSLTIHRPPDDVRITVPDKPLQLLRRMTIPASGTCTAILLLFGIALPGSTGAQEYPNRPVRLIVASSPGSGVDIVARIVAQRMSDVLGGQMFVDNRAGAGGTI